MTTSRRETFQPEELAILGSVFNQIWSVVGAELGDIDHKRKAAARTRLANIVVLLAKSGEFDVEEMKAMSVRIFRSIEKREDGQPIQQQLINAAKRMIYVHHSSAARGPFDEKPSSPVD
jgi:hypothetical protein